MTNALVDGKNTIAESGQTEALPATCMTAAFSSPTPLINTESRRDKVSFGIPQASNAAAGGARHAPTREEARTGGPGLFSGM